MYDFTVIEPEDKHKLYLEFHKSQYSLLHVLSENFGLHEKQIIINHDLIVLQEKLKKLYSQNGMKNSSFSPHMDGWTPTTWMVICLHFRYMCLQELGRKYDETGVTDAISKYDDWVKSRTFNPKDIMAWASGVETAFDGWNNVAGQNPTYMGVVEIVSGILPSDNEALNRGVNQEHLPTKKL